VLSPPRPGKSSIATEPEIGESTLHQMLQGEFHDPPIIGLDPGDFLYQTGRTDIDHRQFGPPNDIGDFVIFDPNDQAITMPLSQPGGRAGTAALFRQIHRPPLMLLHVTHDTIEQGRVTRSEPPAGTLVDVGSTVRVFVSTGREQVVVPPLRGQTREEAIRSLEAANLRLGNVSS
jgi:hypothetical protein